MADFTANSGSIRNVAGNVNSKEAEYMQTVNEIDAQIKHLGQLWSSPVYDQFKSLFDNKLPSLNRGDELMKEFKNKLDTAADSFDSAQQQIMNNLN